MTKTETSEAKNLVRMGGGVVHYATTSGTPWCEPNGRSFGGYVSNRSVYQRTEHAVTCKRCLRTCPQESQ